MFKTLMTSVPFVSKKRVLSSPNFLIVMLLIAPILFGCSIVGAKRENSTDFGLIGIGEIPQNDGIFTSTDCNTAEKNYLDCSAVDVSGRKYVFFEGALSKIILNFSAIKKNTALPAGIVAFEDINSARRKIESYFGIKMVQGTNPNGYVVFSSGYVIKSSTGVYFAMELIANDDDKLIEISQTTDYGKSKGTEVISV